MMHIHTTPAAWSKVRDLNTPPPGPKPGALPDELTLDIAGSLIDIASGITASTNFTAPSCGSGLLLT